MKKNIIKNTPSDDFIHKLHKIKFPEASITKSIDSGNPEIYLPIIHYTLFNYSPLVEKYLSDNHYDMFAKNDLDFIINVFKCLNNLFNYKSDINTNQFFSNTYIDQKILLCNKIIELVIAKDLELTKKMEQINYKQNNNNNYNIKQDINKFYQDKLIYSKKLNEPNCCITQINQTGNMNEINTVDNGTITMSQNDELDRNNLDLRAVLKLISSLNNIVNQMVEKIENFKKNFYTRLINVENDVRILKDKQEYTDCQLEKITNLLISLNLNKLNNSNNDKEDKNNNKIYKRNINIENKHKQEKNENQKHEKLKKSFSNKIKFNKLISLTPIRNILENSIININSKESTQQMINNKNYFKKCASKTPIRSTISKNNPFLINLSDNNDKPYDFFNYKYNNTDNNNNNNNDQSFYKEQIINESYIKTDGVEDDNYSEINKIIEVSEKRYLETKILLEKYNKGMNKNFNN